MSFRSCIGLLIFHVSDSSHLFMTYVQQYRRTSNVERSMKKRKDIYVSESECSEEEKEPNGVVVLVVTADGEKAAGEQIRDLKKVKSIPDPITVAFVHATQGTNHIDSKESKAWTVQPLDSGIEFIVSRSRSHSYSHSLALFGVLTC